MHYVLNILIISVFLTSAGVVASETRQVEFGGDTFVSGEIVNQTLNSEGDVFAAGRTVNAQGQSKGDLHATGFDVTITGNTAEDLYAIGATVVISGQVAEDLMGGGFSVRTEASSSVGRNARLFGKTVTINGPVAGAVLVTGQDVVLNAPVAGDMRVMAQSISFGPEARVDGTFTYAMKEKITVPDRVAAADRVVFEELKPSAMRDQWKSVRKELPRVPTFASLVFGFVVSLLFFVVLGALVLAFLPTKLSAMRKSIARAPGLTLVLGVIGLSILIGLIPITAMTIVGLPFVPIAVLMIILAWILGYALGAYSVAMRVWTGFGGAEDPPDATRLLVFAAAITFVAILNFVPFLGWVANYTLVLLGVGAITHAVFDSVVGPVLDRDTPSDPT